MTRPYRGVDQRSLLRLHAQAVDDTVELKPGRPDLFRAPGVPDRLVISLHREGLFYVGKLTTWEYHEIEVTRSDGPDGRGRRVTEMVVDLSRPHTVDVLVHMSQRPTAARVVAQLVDVLRQMVPGLAGRDRRMPRHAADDSEYRSCGYESQSPKAYPTE